MTSREVNDNMLEKFTDAARQAVSLAKEEADWLNHRCVGTEHILLGILRQSKSAAANALGSLGITLDAARLRVKKIKGQGEQSPVGYIPYTARAEKVFDLSRLESSQLGCNYVGPEHVLLGLIRMRSCLAVQVLTELGADPVAVRGQVMRHLRDDADGEFAAPAGARGEPAPVRLGQFCRDLTQEARMGGLYPVIGREKEIRRVAEVLGRPTRNIPVLVGSNSSALSEVAEGLAQHIAAGHVPGSCKDKHLFALSSSDPDTLETLIDQVRGRHDVILFIAAPSAVTSLASGELQLIAATTPAEYRRHLQGDDHLKKRLHPINIAEPTAMYSIEMLKEALRGATQTRIPRTY
jgi:ATP-dependent Clp protease ATP-binding subunit ClpC